MTAKEKARELFDKFNKGEYLFHQVDVNGAREAAIIAVDEILKLDLRSSPYQSITPYEYWDKVKLELQSF